MNTKKTFNSEDIKAFEPENKVGFIATVNEEGLPHLSLITTIQAKGENELIWGQFSQGMSKSNVLKNNKTGFLIMTMDRNLWKGTSIYKGSEKEGEDYEKFNQLPMWRYNSYFGIHTIHYMDLNETTVKSPLPLGKIILSSLKTKLAAKSASQQENQKIMNSWTQSLFKKLDSLKFLSYVNDEGFPVIIPLLQCQPAGTTKLVFNPGPYKDELMKIKPGTETAIYALSLDMENVLTRGTFTGYKRHRGVKLGEIELNWIYNSMPPMPGQIYPPVELKAVSNF